jgi:hypothetical protein
VHHQHTAVSHDHGGGPFSFAHVTQANRRAEIVLMAVDNFWIYGVLADIKLTEMDRI